MEAAPWHQPWADDQLVTPDQRSEDALHVSAALVQSPSRLARMRVAGASRTAARAPTMKSAFGSRAWACRNDSRIMRRSLLRATEFPTVFAARARPSLGWDKGVGRTTRLKKESPKRRPWRYAASKSTLRRTRRVAGNPRSGVSRSCSIRGSASCGPWRGGGPESCGHSLSPCAHENRGYGRVELC